MNQHSVHVPKLYGNCLSSVILQHCSLGIGVMLSTHCPNALDQTSPNVATCCAFAISQHVNPSSLAHVQQCSSVPYPCQQAHLQLQCARQQRDKRRGVGQGELEWGELGWAGGERGGGVGAWTQAAEIER